MDLEALRADYEQKLLDKQDWYNGGYRTDINSGQAYRETLGFIGDAETQLNDDGFIVKGLKSVWNGATSGISSTLSAIQMLRDKNIQQHLQQQPNYVINQEAVNILDDAQKRFADWRYEVKKEDTFDTIVYGVAEGAGQMASQVATRLLLGGPAAAMLMGAQIAGAQYSELRAQGVEPEKAFEASMTNGVIQGVLEEIGIEKVLKAFPAGSSLNKQIREIATRAVSEGFTESIQSLPEQFTNIWALQNNEGKSSYDTALSVAREWDKNATDNIKDMVFSGIIGTIVGAGGSGLNAVISNKLEKAIVERTTQSLEKSAELIKNKDMNAEYAQATFDALDKGQTLVNLDAEQVVQYAYNQSANIEDVAKSLGTTKEEIENAAAIGGDITVSYGHMASTMAEHNGFTEAMREHMSFGDQGKSLNYYQLQSDLEKTYGEAGEIQESIKAELDAIENSMLDAGIPKDQARQARELYSAFAGSLSPDNPAEWIKNHKVRFSDKGKVNKKDSLFQVAENTIEDITSSINNSDIIRTSKDNNKNNQRIRAFFESNYPDYAIEFFNNKDTGIVEIKSVKTKVEKEKFDKEVAEREANYTKQKAAQDRFYKRVKTPSGHDKLIQSITNRLAKDGFDAIVSKSRSTVSTLSFYVEVGDKKIKISDHNTIGQQMSYDNAGFIDLTESTSVDDVYSRIKNILSDNTDGYNQFTEGTPKGSFSPQADGTYVINMFKGADASTVIHETGHYFFEVFMQESGLDTASDKLKKDRAAFLNYVGMTEEQWQAADFEGRRAAHERVATAFEQYLLEGKAPSKGLRGVFSRFSKWLKAIYGEVVNSDDYAGLTDDVREAFDHWLAADADIEAAMKTRGMYGKLDGKLTSMLSDKQRVWLENQIEGARQKAAEILTKEYMSNFSNERKAAILQFRADIEPEVKEQVHALKVNQARANVAEQFAYARQLTVDGGFANDGRFARSTNKVIVTYKNANASNIAVRYNRTYGYQGMNPQERFNEINKDIESILNPILEELREGIGRGQEYYWYDTIENKEVSDTTATEFINAEEETIKAAKEKAAAEKKANPNGPVTPIPKKSKRYEKRSRSRNAQWYQNWYAKHGRQISDKELFNLAKELYYGKDDYGFYGDAFAKLPADVKAEIDDINRGRKREIEELISLRDNYEASSKILERNKRFGLSDEQRLLFDLIAEELGYSSGSEMAQDILNAKTEERMVQDAIRARVKEKFPDYATERALREQATLKALYDQDEGGMVAALEQQLIEEAAQQAYERELSQEQQAAKMKERIAKAKEAKARAEIEARNLMLNMSISDALRANKFAMQERRATANAKKAMKKGDTQAASEYKHQQMVLHALVRHSLVLKQEVEKTKKFVKSIKKMKKEKFGNDVNFDQVYFMLYRLGVLNYDRSNQEKYKKQLATYNPANHTLSLQEYISQMTEKLGDGIPEISEFVLEESNNIRSRDLSIEQYEQVRDSLQNLMAIVKNDVQSTLDKQAADFEEEKSKTLENLNKLETVYVPSAGGVEVESFWKRQIAQRQSLDNFLEKMDGWTYGYFSKVFGNTLKHCADKQAELKMAFDKDMSDAMNKWCPTKEARRQADQEHYYQELKANANKHTLINMLIHLGNESSMRRLCESRIVGCEQSGLWVIAGENNNYSKNEAINITRQNLIDFLSKNLTKADVEYAQAKVDAVNKLWPLLAEVNLKTKGFAPRKVEATPVAFKPSDGDYMTFNGGYYPLARDGRMGSMRAGAEALSDTENTYTPTNSMSTVQSTSKGRTGAAYPVKLSYGYELNMIEDTIHDIAYRETMMAFNKLLKDQQVYSTLKQKLGIENFNLLRETLWKCARPKNVQDAVMAERSLTTAASWIRRKTVNAVIACNLKVSLQNFGNIFLYGNTVEGFTQADVLAAMPDMFSGLDKHKAMTEQVLELSPFMRERALAPDFAMKEVAEENAILKNYKTAKGIKKAEGVLNKVSDSLSDFEEGAQKFGARMLTITDNITAVPVWLQAYNKQLNMGKSKQEAIDFADTVIRRTLGSNRLQDVASIMRGSQTYKLFTAFQSFFNTQFNQWYREGAIISKDIKQGEYREAFMRAAAFALSKWLLACLANVIIGSASFIKPFEKDEKDWREINKELITYPISMTGGPAGQVALYSVQSLLGMQSYGYRLSIIENTIQKGGSFLYKANSVAQGKKDADELIEPAAEIISIYLGIPLQLVRSGGNFYNIVFDDMSFELEDILTRRRKSERDR